MKRKIFRVIIVVFLTLALFGCIQQPKKLTRISIAFQDWVGYGPFYLGQEKGFFAQEGIELFFVDEQLDSSRRDAFKAGILDCEAGTIDLLVSKLSQDTPLVAVLELDRSFGGDAIIVNKKIKSLEDLIGKRVVFSRDDVSEMFISYLFYKKGLSLKDITVISRSPEEVADVFLRKEADAVVTWEPWVTKALALPGAHILVTTKDYPGVIIDTLNIRKDFVENNPKLVKGLIRAWFKAVKYFQDNPEEASRIIAKYYGISPEAYRKSISNLKWTGYKEQVELGKSGAWKEVFALIAKIKFENGRITKIPDSKNAINTVLIQGAYENSR